MAKEHSFDITAELDAQEMKNAIEQAKKEVSTRYDFKGLKADIDYNAEGKSIVLVSSSDAKAEAMVDIVMSKIIKRGIPSKAVNEDRRDQVGGGNTKIVLSIVDDAVAAAAINGAGVSRLFRIADTISATVLGIRIIGTSCQS